MNSVSPLHRLFRVLFLIINEISVWAVYRPHYDERILFSNGKNDNSTLEILRGSFESMLYGFHWIKRRIVQK